MSVSYIPAPFLISDEKKSASFPGDRKISKQLDELQRMSKSEREQKQGPNHGEEMRALYNLSNYASTAVPSFRPRVILPEAQFLMMCEATDLTNDTPKVYISVGGKADEQREKAFSSAWRLGMFNNRIF